MMGNWRAFQIRNTLPQVVYREKMLADLIHMKIFKEKQIDNLMFITKYEKHFSDMFAKYALLFSKTSECDFQIIP